jgi:hypothetical protein
MAYGRTRLHNGSLNRVADFPRSVFIAKQFGVDPGTVQRISRPFDRVGIVVA